MTLDEVSFIFNRALSKTFGRVKLLWTFAVLVLSGVLAVFFRALAFNAGPWLAQSLIFLPIFLSAGFVLSLGILLIRIYHDEIKKRKASFKETLGSSWDEVVGASYFSVPIILCYLLLWMLLGVFVLLSDIPGLGDFFGVILAFGPFLINLGALVLIVLNLGLLFYVGPILALKGFNRIQVSRTLTQRFQQDIFSNLFLALVAVVPLLLIAGLLGLAALLTGTICDSCVNPIQNVLLWFFTMIPFTAFLSPPVVFFFNFAAEAHVLMMKNLKS